jgi:hypothetical protein
MRTVTVDFVARAVGIGWSLVLVEQGPWRAEEVDAHLRRLQDRLYDCIDVALDGTFADKYSEASGGPIVIRVDGYDLPEEPVRQFFARFAGVVLQLPEYAAALAASNVVPSIGFELNLETLRTAAIEGQHSPRTMEVLHGDARAEESLLRRDIAAAPQSRTED